MGALFGPAGNSVRFYDEGNKSTLQMPSWLSKQGLDCFEYPFGQGVRIKEETAKKIGDKAKEYNILMSAHAPYFINLSNVDSDKRLKSRDYIYQTVVAASHLGANRVVFHPGACRGMDRKYALQLALDELIAIDEELILRGYSHITLCPETMGKINQLGDLDEVISMCKYVPSLIPAIDFGHLNARGQGNIVSSDDYRKIIDKIGNGIGEDKMKRIHVHFSHIEYTKAGEKRHLTFDDNVFGPYFPPLAKILIEYKMSPTIICESRGTMADDAMTMKQIYNNMT